MASHIGATEDQNKPDIGHTIDPLGTSTETPTTIGVIYLPHDAGVNHPIRDIQIPLVEIGPGGISRREYTNFERLLGRIPDIRASDAFTFGWDHRVLFDVSEGTWDARPHGSVCKMYLCMDRRSGLPHNLGLELLTTWPEIFGDAFVFKLEADPDGTCGARYLHWGEDFVMTGSEKVRWRDAIRDVYFKARQRGRREGKGTSTQKGWTWVD